MLLPPARRSTAAHTRRRGAPSRTGPRPRAVSPRTRPQRSSSQLAKRPRPLQAAAVAAHLSTAAGNEVHLRPRRRAHRAQIRIRGLDARRRKAQVGVVGESLGDQRVERRIVPRSEPVVGDCPRTSTGRRPLCRKREVRRRLFAHLVARRRVAQGAGRDCQRSDQHQRTCRVHRLQGPKNAGTMSTNRIFTIVMPGKIIA